MPDLSPYLQLPDEVLKKAWQLLDPDARWHRRKGIWLIKEALSGEWKEGFTLQQAKACLDYLEAEHWKLNAIEKKVDAALGFWCQDNLDAFGPCKSQCAECKENQPPPQDEKLKILIDKMKASK